MSEIASWLAGIGLAKYVALFEKNELDLDSARHLSDSDLKELGLPLGPRRKILAAIGEISNRSGARPERDSTDVGKGAERRQLTVMFVDLVGSTELSQRLDPEEMREVIHAYQRAVSAEVLRYDGHVAKLMGDGVLVYFGWPSAHEDDAERAIRAGLTTVAKVSALETPRGDRLAARIGIATGLVVVGDLIGEGASQEEAVVGEAPNLAARLQVLAEPNSVVVADATRRLTAGLFEVVDLGRRELKGFSAAVPAWRIRGEAAIADPFRAKRGGATPLVGRDAELRHLLGQWEAAQVGRGQVVLVSGEPGIGKSRLVAAVEERLSGRLRSIRYFCSPYHTNSAFHPVIGQLERAARIQGSDGHQARLQKLKTLLKELGSNRPGIVPLLAELLSIDVGTSHARPALSPQARREHTNAALLDLVAGSAEQNPILMMVEDVHWIDPTTLEWLDRVVDRARGLAILLLLTFRPDFEPRWKDLPHVSELRLERLSAEEGAAIGRRIAGGKPLPPEVEEQILARSEGIPLFVEELTKAVIESGAVVNNGDSYAMEGSLALAVPATLQDSLMARLDRLGGAKELAQIGACVGRTFQYRLIAVVSGMDEAQLVEALQRLEESELVFRQGMPPEAAYTFKHALVQNTAYDSLLRRRRQNIHATIAATLAADFAEVVAAEPETLAHHHTAAGSASTAAPYWLKAGQAALKRSANREATAHLRKGIELIESQPDSEDGLRLEIQLQAALGVAMMGARGFGSPEVLAAMSRARVLSEKLGDASQLFIALCGEASYHMISGHLREADALGAKCMALATSAGNVDLLLEAHHRQWATKFFMGDYPAAERHVDHGVAVYDPDRHHHLTFTHTGHDPGVCCRSYSSQMLWLRGYPDQALERSREAVALAERVSHPLSLILAASRLSEIHLCRREPAEARALIAKWESDSNKLVLPLLTPQARFQRGWALSEEGNAGQGVVEMREGITAVRETGAAMGLQHFLCVLAQGHAASGMAAEGMAVLDEALRFAADTGARYQYPELLRTKGEILLQLDPADRSAEGWLRSSLAAAQEEGTKMLELRAAASLARLARDGGEHKKARDVLEPIYAWFREGLGTSDLVGAKALLEEVT